MYTSIDFSSRQGGFVHQFGVWLGRDLKNRLLLLL
jgi:hypothetical protein